MKICSKCKIESDNFGPDKRRKNGLQSQCRLCMKIGKGLSNIKYKQKIRKASRLRYKANIQWYHDYEKRPERRISKATREANRRAMKLQATPKWLTKNQIEHIKAYYETAEMLSKLWNIDMEVDHIVPLKGVNVCGLHVPWNLQIMVGTANRIKGNRL